MARACPLRTGSEREVAADEFEPVQLYGLYFSIVGEADPLAPIHVAIVPSIDCSAVRAYDRLDAAELDATEVAEVRHVRWSGALWLSASDVYRFYFSAEGSVTIAARTIIDTLSGETEGLVSAAADGFVEILVLMRQPRARCSAMPDGPLLEWSSGSFERQAISCSFLRPHWVGGLLWSVQRRIDSLLADWRGMDLHGALDASTWPTGCVSTRSDCKMGLIWETGIFAAVVFVDARCV